MPSIFLTSFTKRTPYQPGDYERARKRFQQRLDQTASNAPLARDIAQAIDQQPGDLDQKFDRASKALFQVFSNTYTSTGERPPRCLGKIIDDSKMNILALYGKTIGDAIIGDYHQNYPALLRQDLLDSKAAGTAFYREMMDAVEAEMQKGHDPLDSGAQSSVQIKDAIKEHFHAKGFLLYDLQASAIKNQTDYFLKAEFRSFYQTRRIERRTHLQKHLSEPTMRATNTLPPRRLTTVTFNPRITVHVHQEIGQFSANDFAQRPRLQHRRSFIFDTRTQTSAPIPEPRLNRKKSYPG